MYPPPWKGCEELLVMPFSATWVSCVSSCVVLRDATLSSSKAFTLATAGTEEKKDMTQTLETHPNLFNEHVINQYITQSSVAKS